MGLAGYNLVWFVIHPASNVCFHFTWALQAILISFLTSFAVAGCFGLVFFALLLNVPPLFVWAYYVLCPAVNGLPFCGPCWL